MLTTTLEALAMALGLGLLVGLQRERVESRLAGLRTFPIITVFGVLCALLAQTYGGWVIGAGVLALAAMVVAGNVLVAQDDDAPVGITTEVAILVMFAVGAVLFTGPMVVGVVVGGGLFVLLHVKPQLQRLVAAFSDDDVHAIMQFTLVTLVILPVLPDETFGPYGVLNPRNIWFMVVLVVGVSLAGYVAQRLVGERLGTLAAGLLGGLVSSTATTIGFARRTKSRAGFERLAAVVILLAATVLHGRVLVEIAVVAPGFLRAAAPPIAAAGAVAVILAIVAWTRVRHRETIDSKPENPAEMRSALLFAAIYAAVLLVTAAARDRFGDQSIYVVAVLSGVTDMDAITLSTARLANEGQIEPSVAWRAILLAAISNTLFKAGAVWVVGSRALASAVTVWFAVLAGATGAIVLLWPG